MEAKEEFLEIFKNNINREGSSELLKFLNNSDFFTAPASTKFHSAFSGGLCLHSINVYKRFLSLIKQEYGENYTDKVSNETIAIISLLHDICKVNYYEVDYKNVKKYCDNGTKFDNKGRFEWETEEVFVVKDTLPYGHGEKSVYMISSFIKLSREEAMAINWHMGGFDLRVKAGSYSISDAFYTYPLALLFHIADLEATYLDER